MLSGQRSLPERVQNLTDICSEMRACEGLAVATQSCIALLQEMVGALQSDLENRRFFFTNTATAIALIHLMQNGQKRQMKYCQDYSRFQKLLYFIASSLPGALIMDSAADCVDHGSHSRMFHSQNPLPRLLRSADDLLCGIQEECALDLEASLGEGRLKEILLHWGCFAPGRSFALIPEEDPSPAVRVNHKLTAENVVNYYRSLVHRNLVSWLEAFEALYLHVFHAPYNSALIRAAMEVLGHAKGAVIRADGGEYLYRRLWHRELFLVRLWSKVAIFGEDQNSRFGKDMKPELVVPCVYGKCMETDEPVKMAMLGYVDGLLKTARSIMSSEDDEIVVGIGDFESRLRTGMLSKLNENAEWMELTRRGLPIFPCALRLLAPEIAEGDCESVSFVPAEMQWVRLLSAAGGWRMPKVDSHCDTITIPIPEYSWPASGVAEEVHTGAEDVATRGGSADELSENDDDNNAGESCHCSLM